MPLKAYLFIVTIVAICTGIIPVSAQEQSSFTCPATPIDISPVSSQDQVLVCNAAEKARIFFQSHGIEIQRQVHIQLHQDEIKNHAHHIGLYHANKNHIDMVTLDHATHHCSEKPPFNIQMNDALYVSFVVHEVAHAIADQNFNEKPSSLIVPEYLAYVTQFSTMDTHAQNQILQKYKVAPFSGIEDMSLTYYQLDPNAFGVKAFRHYQSLPDKSRFIQDLLSGAIKPNAPQMEWW